VEESLRRIRDRLREAGAIPEELDAADDLDGLYRLAGELGLRPPGERLSLVEVADRAGLPLGRVQQLLTAAGLSGGDIRSRQWSALDVDLFRGVDAARAIFGDEVILAIMRRTGVAMSQLAHATAAAFRVNVGVGTEDLSPIEVVERNLSSGPLIDLFMAVLGETFRYHSLRAVKDESVAAGRYGELRPMAVGFVDVAASTVLGSTIDAARLGELIADFDSAASDAASRAGARVVKTIGDEVMLSSERPEAVVAAALDLVAFCRDHDTFVAARAGICAGVVLDQDGDCYGPVVNRAARFVEAAADGAVMVDEAVGAALGPALTVEPCEPLEHRGIGRVEWLRVRPRAQTPS
jgi:adenylate cyclase